jgi:putative ABC transport system permease protein
VSTIRGGVEGWLARQYGPAWKDRVSVSTNQARVEQAQQGMLLFKLFMGALTGISLLVGGIGIMNVLLASVIERTREIGIRKALGARRSDILSQFLVEALTLSVLGGLIGIAIGLLASAVIGQIAGWGFIFDPLTVVIATIFSLAVGVVFGVWPARQAAQLDPVVALRFE